MLIMLMVGAGIWMLWSVSTAKPAVIIQTLFAEQTSIVRTWMGYLEAMPCLCLVWLTGPALVCPTEVQPATVQVWSRFVAGVGDGGWPGASLLF